MVLCYFRTSNTKRKDHGLHLLSCTTNAYKKGGTDVKNVTNLVFIKVILRIRRNFTHGFPESNEKYICLNPERF